MSERNMASENATSTESSNPEPIAIVGIGCRFPGGANDPYQFWDNIKNGMDCLQPTPESRWNTDVHFSRVKGKKGKINTRWGGYIDGFDEFDPLFFGISPREAEHMDPQQRKLLEVAWEAMEDGGVRPSTLSGRPVGVFVGGFTVDYKILQFTNPNFDSIAAHTATGVMMTMLSNRLSYIYNLKGPSLTIDTACSSSLVAVDLACKSLQQGDTEMALAGGALLLFAPQYTVSETQGGFLSPTGNSHAFAATANGYVRSEGVALLLLKRLRDAEADGDNIHAVILGTAVNQDGRTNGITVPNPDSQLELMQRAYRRAGVEPCKVQYIETHGTGTPVGDPLEAQSVGRLVTPGRAPQDKVYIGSVKTNIGHTESAAGTAGLIKTVLALKHRQIPPHLHFSAPNQAIAFDEYAYTIPTELTPWPDHEGPMLAGVNSFGFGGTNAHVVLQAYRPEEAARTDLALDRHKILLVSHADQEGLTQQIQATYDQVARIDDEEIYHLGYSSATRRERHPYQALFWYRNRDELLTHLDTYLHQHSSTNCCLEQLEQGEPPRLVWVLTGMGPQWWGMGHDLYRSEPVFRATIDELEQAFAKFVDWSLVKEMFANAEDSRMSETWLAQTANFAVQVALAALWRSYGIEPDAIVGHSTGEAAAFYLAGVYSLEDAVKVIVHRSRLQHTTRGSGKMLAVGLSDDAVLPYLAKHSEKVSIGAVNSPNAVTLTGDADALQAIAERCQANEVFNKFLRVEVPYHSPIMDRIKDELIACLQGIEAKPAQIPLYSTMTGARVGGEELDAEYWWQNVRRPVQFAKAIGNMMVEGYRHFLEIGPQPVLGASIGEVADSLERTQRSFYSIRREYPEAEDFYGSLARLAGIGIAVDWNAMYPGARFVRMPRYQWLRDHYWYETPFYARLRKGAAEAPLLGSRSTEAQGVWHTDISLERYPYLSEHIIQNSCLFPGAGFVELVYAAMQQHWGPGYYGIEDVRIEKGVFLSEDTDPALDLVIDESSSHFKIVSTSTQQEEGSAPSAQETRHFSGLIRSRPSARLAGRVDLEYCRNNSFEATDKKVLYPLLEGFGYQYGPAFQAIETLWIGDRHVLAKIELPAGLETTDYHLHPSLLDACLQTLIVYETNRLKEGDELIARLPVAIDRIDLNPDIPQQFWCAATIVHRDDEKIVGDLLLCDDDGTVLGELTGFNAQAVDTVASGMNLQTIDSWLYRPQWALKEQEDEEPQLAKAYLIFADLGGQAQRLAEDLRRRGCAVSLAFPGSSYSAGEDLGEFILEPNNIEQLRTCLQAFATRYPEDSGIIHCIGLDGPPSLDQIQMKELESLKESHLHSLIFIARVICEADLRCKLWVVTGSGQVVTEGDAARINVLAASITGISRVLAQHELCDNWGRQIDLANQGEDLIPAIVSELGSPAEEQEVGHRDGRRYVSRLVPAEGLRPPFPVRMKPNACYLVAGGFGAIGRLVCRWLIHKGARRILLITRTTFPSRDSWKSIDSGHRLYERIAFVNELESMGAEILLADVDVTCESELRHYFKDYFEQQMYPPIRGVFFCSGVVKDALVSSIEREDFDPVYETKTVGATVLHQCLADTPLDHFVLFSSIAGQVATAGQVNYAAANTYLDALAQYRCAIGLPALSINWGPWAIGMIKELGLADHYKNQRGMPPILPEAGIKVLERILDLPDPQLSVCDAHWNKVRDWYPKRPALFKDLGDEGEVDEQADDFLSRYVYSPSDQRKNLVELEFKKQIAQILRTDPGKIAGTDVIVALGIDSIMGVELNNRMLAHFGTRLSVVKLLGNLSIRALAEELEQKIAVLAEARGVGADGALVARDGLAEVVDETPKNPFSDLEVEDEYPLSYGQKAIWFTHQLNPESAAYNIGGVMQIPAAIDIPTLEKAVNGVIKRHPLLRANFYVVNGEPVQRVYTERPYQLSVVDVRGQDWDAIREQVIADNLQPFDLENEPLFRIRLYEQSHESYYFAITIYHIISDAWSNYMFLNEMQALYARYLKAGDDQEIEIVQPKVGYRQFVEHENRLINSIRGNALYKFWRNRLPAEIPQLALPTDKQRPAVMTNNGASLDFVIDANLTAQLQQLAKQEGTTTFVALLSIYFILMHKYTQQNDIIVGCPVAGRDQAEFAEIYGYFVNPLPMWARFDDRPDFRRFLAQVRESTLLALENQEFPFSLLVDRLEMEHDPSRSAIFQVMFVLLNHQVERSHIDENNVAHYEGFPMRLLRMPEEEGQFDITISLYEEKGVYYGTFKYNTDLFFETTIARMAEHFIEITRQVLADPSASVSDFHLITAAERTRILHQWSGEAAQQRVTDWVHERVEAHAAQAPAQPAVRMSEDGVTAALTYAELNQQANRIAHLLIDKEVAPGSVVGLYLDKSPLLISALLGCLKAGATYLVLDREQPLDRLNHMLTQSAARMVLTAGDQPEGLNATVHALAEAELKGYDSANPGISTAPDLGAYIVFTSGSTGYPKGVLVTHQNCASIAAAWASAYQLDQTQVHLQMASTSFDVFCGDWMRALTTGKTLQLCPRSTLLNIPLLADTIAENGVDFAEFVPTVMRKLVDYLRSKDRTLDMRMVVVASERWTVKDYQELRYVTRARIFNSYGTSEATIDSTYFEANPQTLGRTTDLMAGIPIGRPFNNSLLYILDPFGNPVPAGVLGELYIGGDGVSAGYINDQERTREAFVELSISGGEPTRLYRTGDLARWDETGLIHFEGREDTQVKIRGHRIELSEIEKAIVGDTRVRQAIVVIQQNAMREPCLAAYFDAIDVDIDPAEVRQSLAARLPSYMLPSSIQRLDRLPELDNGKIDLKALPKPEPGQQADLHAPQTLYEKKVAEIWTKMLGIQGAGLYDDFFELGGNSLYLIELMVQLQEAFGVQLSINQMFKLSTLVGMAKTIEEIVTGKQKGAAPYIVYNGAAGRTHLFSFPPAGGYSIVYQALAEAMPETTLVSFNYLTEEDKLQRYCEHILRLQPQGPYHLFGYSLGGNLAFEVAVELERRGHRVERVVIMDSYRILDDLEITEQILNDFREELRGHFEKHTGSRQVQDHTMMQANNYIDFVYQQKNLQQIDAAVDFIVEANDRDPYRENKLTSWEGGSGSAVLLHLGVSLHEDMLLGDNAVTHGQMISDILQRRPAAASRQHTETMRDLQIAAN